MEKSKCFGQIRTIGRGWWLWAALWRCVSRGSLLALTLLASGQTYAVDYYWMVTTSVTTSINTAHYSSPSSACDAILNYFVNANAAVNWRIESLYRNSNTSYGCLIYRQPQSGGAWTQQGNYGITRNGDTCPVGTTYNSSTGLCDAQDPCLSTVGNPISHQHRLGDFTGTGQVGGYTPPPGVLCSNSCQYASNGGAASNVFRFADNSPNGVFGVYTYTGNGVQCTGGEAGVTAPGSSTPNTDKSSECTNKVTDAEGRVSYSCTAADVFKDPGSMNCGEVDGQFECYSKTPIPTLTDKEVTTEVTETTNADGSKDTTTTTTTNKTTCSGVGSCSTTTTTNVTNSRTNADGSAGAESSSCTGADCGKTGEQGEEETEPSTVSGDTACTALPACQGDAIQCAILRQTHQQRCQTEEFQKIDMAQLDQDVAAEFAGAAFQPIQPTADSTFDFSTMLDTSSTVSAGCPALPDLSFSVAGQSDTFDFGIATDELCKYANWFSYLLVAFAMWRAAEILARGFV